MTEALPTLSHRLDVRSCGATYAWVRYPGKVDFVPITAMVSGEPKPMRFSSKLEAALYLLRHHEGFFTQHTREWREANAVLAARPEGGPSIKSVFGDFVKAKGRPDLVPVVRKRRRQRAET